MKNCPFCAEEIQDAAIVCKHCRRDLTPGRITDLTSQIATTPLEHSDDVRELALQAKKIETIKPQSPAAALGGLIVFAGLWLLFMGISEYYGGSSTRDLYSGTVLEHDADMNRIMNNAMSAGMTKIAFGIVALLLGGGIAAYRRDHPPNVGATQPPVGGPITVSSPVDTAAGPPPAGHQLRSRRRMFGVLTSAIGFALMVALAVSAGPPDKPPTDARMLIGLLGFILLWIGFAVAFRGSRIIRWGGGFLLASITGVFPAIIARLLQGAS